MNLSGVTFVIVNNHEGVRSALGTFLRGKGAIVFISPDAFDGLTAVKNHKPDIVISSIRLPKRDGFELLRDIRALGSEAGGNVPVIATTILAQRTDRNRITAAGFDGHLDKPFIPNQLLEVIKSLLPLNARSVKGRKARRLAAL
ncbi:MAG: response regulator [Verrucomicrobia bacterium]|nr:response regulator [Verrucomicrobiota bacterium]